MIENTGEYKSNVPSIIRYDLQSKYTGLKLNHWDAIVSNDTINYILFFIGDMYYFFDIKKNKIISKTSMIHQWKNIWKINVNNL